MLRLAKALQCSVDDLLVGVDPEYDSSRAAAAADGDEPDPDPAVVGLITTAALAISTIETAQKRDPVPDIVAALPEVKELQANIADALAMLRNVITFASGLSTADNLADLVERLRIVMESSITVADSAATAISSRAAYERALRELYALEKEFTDQARRAGLDPQALMRQFRRTSPRPRGRKKQE